MNKEVHGHIDLEALRRSFIQAELKRIQRASQAMAIMGVLSLGFLAALAFARYPTFEWQLIALLGFAAFCLAFPLFRKFDLSRDGSGFETRDPLELIEAMEAKTTEARSESFEQLRTLIGGLSEQLKEVATLVASHAAASGTAPAEETDRERTARVEGTNEEGEPSMRKIRHALPPITHQNDPQKGRFGGDEARNGRILSAKVEPSAVGDKWQKVTLTVSVTNDQPMQGRSACFFLHDTFQPSEYKIPLKSDARTASLEVLAYGAFTAGAVVDCGTTCLELDLATSPQVEAPTDWRNR